MRKRHRPEERLGASKRRRCESQDDIEEDVPGGASSSRETTAPTQHVADEDIAEQQAFSLIAERAISTPGQLDASQGISSLWAPQLSQADQYLHSSASAPQRLSPQPPAPPPGRRSPLERPPPLPSSRPPPPPPAAPPSAAGDEEARWLADHVQQILLERMANNTVESDEPTGEPEAPGQHFFLLSFLLGEVRFLTEEEHAGGAVTHRTFIVPIWMLFLGIFLFTCAASLYGGMVRELRLMQPAMAEVVRTPIVGGVCTNITDAVVRVVCRASAANTTDTAGLQRCLDEGPELPAAVLRAAEAFTSSLSLHCLCRERMPSNLAMLCPDPFPDSPFFYPMVHPIESWALPAVLLDAPRLGSLYIAKYVDYYGVEDLLAQSTFWLAWLFTPHLAAALLAAHALYATHPVLTTVYVLFCCRGQITEWRQLVHGPPGTLVFLLLDTVVYAAIYLTIALVLPALALNLTLVWSWVGLFNQTLNVQGWWNAPLRQPLSKALLQQVAQHLFSIWTQEIRRSGYANYPANYAESSTTSEELQCTICCNNKKDTALIPCCHVVCKTCAHRLPRGECPFCHAAFHYMQFIRL